MKTKAITKSIEVANEVFSDFIQDVVGNYVVSVRANPFKQPTEKFLKGNIDNRPIHLLSVSGKGSSKFPQYENVTLLDHLLSVARGALILAILDDVTELDEADIPFMKRSIVLIIITAFLHDLDKDLAIERVDELTVEHVALRMGDEVGAGYGLTQWMSKYDLKLSNQQILALICSVEASQHYRYLEDTVMPKEASWAMHYVEVTDKLDGIWLEKGIFDALEFLQTTTRLKTNINEYWQLKPLEIYDPHHPFLLDLLQQSISRECSLHLGIPPLIETHKDGRLLMVLPKSNESNIDILEKGLARFARGLPSGLTLYIEAKGSKGIPSIIGGQPDYAGFYDELNDRLNEDAAYFARIFYLKKVDKEVVEKHLAELLDDVGIELSWQGENIVLPFTRFEHISIQGQKDLLDAAIAALIMNTPFDGDKGKVTRKSIRAAFLQLLGDDCPNWITEIKDKKSQATIMALWAALVLQTDSKKIYQAIWGEEGLFPRLWDEEINGLRYKIPLGNPQDLEETLQHFRALLRQQRVVTKQEESTKHCLVTNSPVNSDRIKGSDLLYGIKMSAFSGRSGRNESTTLTHGETYLSPITTLEYKLRKLCNANSEEQDFDCIPTTLSFPVTSGLFGGFGMNDNAIKDESISRLLTLSFKKQAIQYNLNYHQQRSRVARFFCMSKSIEGQLDDIQKLLKISQRMGRPIHLFKGLPTQQKAFFYYDAMPTALVQLLNGNSLRLDQLETAIKKLEFAKLILKTPGLGFSVFQLLSSPIGRLGAMCQAYIKFLDNKKPVWQWKPFLHEQIQSYYHLKEDTMSSSDQAFIELAKRVSKVQKRVHSGTANNEQLRVFNKIFETLQNTIQTQQTHYDSLIYAIAGDLDKDLGENRYASAKEVRNDEPLLKACMEVARYFVHEIWVNVFKQKLPSQKNKATLANIYRVALIMTFEEMPSKGAKK